MSPKRFRVLVTDEIDPDGVAILSGEPALLVEKFPTLSAAELARRIPEYDALVGRSATRITADLLRAGARLRVIGRAGVGVDNIALDAATQLGIAVINAPAGNTVAVAELLFANLLAMLRHVEAASASMRAGRWDRSQLVGRELRGRTLGIVGLGRIGSEVARRALAFDMPVMAYDPYVADARFQALRVERVGNFTELLEKADVLTLHVPLTEETKGMIGTGEIARMRPGAILANLARGGIVDEDALAEALKTESIAGAILDVFEREPLAADHPLRTLPNVLLTPHIGAATGEAQRNVAVEVCEAVRDVLLRDELSASINIAAVDGISWPELKKPLQLTEKAASVARSLLATQGEKEVRRLALRTGSRHLGGGAALLAAAASGVLSGVVESERLNLINAISLAEARGIELSVSEGAVLEEPTAVEISVSGATREQLVAGTAGGGGVPRLTRIGPFHVDVQLRGTLIVLTNDDVPGVIGRVGTLLGDAGVNIAEYHQARLAEGGDALAAISVDGEVREDTREQLLRLADVRSATVIHFDSDG